MVAFVWEAGSAMLQVSDEVEHLSSSPLGSPVEQAKPLGCQSERVLGCLLQVHLLFCMLLLVLGFLWASGGDFSC